MADPSEQKTPALPAKTTKIVVETPLGELTAEQTIAETREALPFQFVTVSDAYGSPVLFASLIVYILMRLLVKPYLQVSLAKRKVPKEERGAWVMRATFLPGLIAACVVDFTPIAEALGVPLHYIAAIPVGALFYAGGGMVIHEVLKRVDPIGLLVAKLGGKTDKENKAAAEDAFIEATGMINIDELAAEVAAKNKKEGKS